MKKIIVLLLFLNFVGSANSQNGFQYKSLQLTDSIKLSPEVNFKSKPKPVFDEMIGQFFIGNLVGLAGGFGAGYLGYAVTKKGHGEWDGFGGALIGFVAGHCAGSIIGVYTAGSSKKLSGDLSATILGGVTGTIGGIGVIWATRVSGAGLIAAAPLPTIGAMIGFNNTLYYKKNVSEIKNSGSQLKIKNDFEVTVLKINF